MSNLTLSFDDRIYSSDALQKVAYKFIDKLSVNFEIHGNQIICLITTDKNLNEDQLQRLESEFKKEALDQNLRVRISSETEAVRNLILSATFSNTGLQKVE